LWYFTDKPSLFFRYFKTKTDAYQIQVNYFMSNQINVVKRDGTHVPFSY